MLTCLTTDLHYCTVTAKVKGRMVYARYVAKLLTKDGSVVSSGVGGYKKLLLDGVVSLIDCTRQL
jgi:hypothetical protein